MRTVPTTATSIEDLKRCRRLGISVSPTFIVRCSMGFLDEAGNTVAAASTLDQGFSVDGKSTASVAAAKAVGRLVAQRAVEKGIKKVVFDRGGYLYHGRVASLADGAREGGLEF